MAFQVGASCYETELQAAQAFSSSILPVQTPDFLISYAGLNGTKIVYQYKNLAQGTEYFAEHPYVASPCNMLTSSDAVDVGWAIGGVWLSIYAITFLIRYFWGETQGTTHAGDS